MLLTHVFFYDNLFRGKKTVDKRKVYIHAHDRQLLKSTFYLGTLKDICNLGYPVLNWLMQGQCSTLTTAQKPFKLPPTSRLSSANMLMSNALIMCYHTFKCFPTLPSQEINTMCTTYREERKWNIGSWFKWANPIWNCSGWRECINWGKNYLFIFINSWHHHHLVSKKRMF